jgi:glycosyltransferase involved in cell wall biosynthesis
MFCSALVWGQNSVGIFTFKVAGVQPWDADSIKSGITGSEEAVIYMAEQLARLGYKVIVFADPPKDSVHSRPEANPRFVNVDFNDGSKFDIAIAWRMPDQALTLKSRAKKVYLWPHDTYHYPLNEAMINGFDDVLWLSEWQREQWISVNPGFAKFKKIFGNGVNPEQFKEVQKRENPYSCIYSSNYARGLEVLLNIWPEIKKEFPKATLDIYYGWQHWGNLSQGKEFKMRLQVAQLASQGVQEHGLVGHEELNQAYAKTSLWTYPCIAPETFCITALRAQMAGAIPVIIEGSALKETVRNGFRCTTQEEYTAILKKALQQADQASVEERKKQGDFIRTEYSWEAISKKWHQLFQS